MSDHGERRTGDATRGIRHDDAEGRLRRLRALALRMLDPMRRAARERDLDEELAAHLQLHIDDNLRAGMSPAEARREALLRLGGVESTKERYRDRRGLPTVDSLAQDVRHGLRLLRRNPGFSLVVVASLALGIGANTAMFSILNALLLRDLPVKSPHQLAILAQTEDHGDSWTYPIWEQFRQHASLVDGAAAWSASAFSSPHGGRPAQLRGLYVSGELFDVLGVQPALGRLFAPADDRRGGGPDGPVVVLGARFWQARFGGAPDVIGKPLTLNGVAFTIIGVASPEFLGPEIGSAFDVAVPLGSEPLIAAQDSWLDRRSTWWLTVIVRVKAGQTFDAAAAALRAVQPRIRAATLPTDLRPVHLKDYLATPVILKPAANGVSDLRQSYERPLMILLGVVGLVLLIACANIANLLLARADARRPEFALRLALGASRLRLARQVLVESLVLASGGAALGLLIAAWSSRLLVGSLSTTTSRVVLDLSFDWRVLAFTSVMAIGTALLFGVTPALQAGRLDPNDALKSHGRSVTGERRFGLGSLLVVAQVALSLVIVVGAGLFVGTLARLAAQPLGFDRDRVLIANVYLLGDEIKPEGRPAFFERLRAAVESIPGVARASASVVTPLAGGTWGDTIETPGEPSRSEDDRRVRVNLVSPGFFETYGTRVLAGRDFAPADTAGSHPVVIVNETFARTFFGGAPPLGRTVQQVSRPDRPGVAREVVGYVADAVYRDLREPIQPTIYIPLPQRADYWPNVHISVRSASGNLGTLEGPVTSALNGTSSNLSISMSPLSERTRNSLLRERLLARLSGAFGALALLLAGIGLYGVTSYAVTRRRTEMGIRMALGAAPARVLRLVLTRVIWLMAIGLVAGLAATLWASRFVATLLYGLEPRDPMTLASAAALLALIGLLAGAVPAWRAARIDPAKVLHEG